MRSAKYARTPDSQLSVCLMKGMNPMRAESARAVVCVCVVEGACKESLYSSEKNVKGLSFRSRGRGMRKEWRVVTRVCLYINVAKQCIHTLLDARPKLPRLTWLACLMLHASCLMPQCLQETLPYACGSRTEKGGYTVEAGKKNSKGQKKGCLVSPYARREASCATSIELRMLCIHSLRMGHSWDEMRCLLACIVVRSWMSS